MIYPLSSLAPSVNAMYVARGRYRYKTKEYCAWLVRAMSELKRWPPFNCDKFSCDIRVPYCLKDRSDIDNRIKGTLDIFVKAKLIPDDRHCMDLRIRYVKETQQNKVEVEFLEVDENNLK